MALLVFPLEVAQAAAPVNLGENAALKYWQAFATLPRFTDAEQKKIAAECLTMPLDAQARQFVTRAAYSLQMLHRGAAQPRCDWGLSWEEQGIDVRLPQGNGARALANLAFLRARLRFDEGHNADAIDDIVAAMTLARHSSRDTINIMLLVGYAIEHRAIEALAQSLPRLDAATIRALKKRLDALPPSTTAAAALKVEEQFALEWFVRKVKEAKDAKSLIALLGQCTDSDIKARDSAERGRIFLEKCGGTAAGVLAAAGEVRASYALMAKKLDLPLEQFAREYDQEVKKRAGNMVFRVLFPAIDRVRLLQLRADLRRALLSAALAVQLDGKDALKKHPDPVVGGSFEHIAFKGGFELRSKWKLDEKLRSQWKLDKRFDEPLTLVVGTREQGGRP
jgi:hypothetical protein